MAPRPCRSETSPAFDRNGGFALKFCVALLMISLSGIAPGVAVGDRGPAAPRAFFGISPQTELTDRDAEYMRAGGIGSIRWPLVWAGVQADEGGPYSWRGFDRVVRTAAQQGLRVLPSLGGRRKGYPLGEERRGWRAFVRAAVRRYGPGGGFWSSRSVPYLPIRTWQVWNEPNFFYFAHPISPRRYGRLVRVTSREIKAVAPRANVVLGGLFGRPKEPRQRGIAATRFLQALYKVPGLQRHFDGVALHPYAADVAKLTKLVRGMRSVTRRKGDGRVPLYITEMGWGSQNDPEVVAFEKGLGGQARELRRAYRFLLMQRGRLGINSVYWFSWKDLAGSCSFCDSAGLFYAGSGFDPKPAWRAFLKFSGGRSRPGD
jgi:hypothetical protein